jgi:hypothetical protein
MTRIRGRLDNPAVNTLPMAVAWRTLYVLAVSLALACESTFAPPIPPEAEWTEGTWQYVLRACPFGFVSEPDGIELLTLEPSGDALWTVGGNLVSVERFEIRRQEVYFGNLLVIVFEHRFAGNPMAISQVPPDTMKLVNPNVTDPCGFYYTRPVG